jgi:sugar fermentation stimulation protein A
MDTLQLYPAVEGASFVERDNRFVMTLKKADGELIKAYVANPGRMEEFLVPGHPFYITAGNSGKYFYHVVSTSYRGSYVLLDTIKINYLVEEMLKRDRIEAFAGEKTYRREVTVSRSRFDFLVERKERKPVLLEVKSCSLSHEGVGMFPDAPTRRGRRHLEDLDDLADKGYDTYILYLTTHTSTSVFVPNGHTDPDYCAAFNRSHHVGFLAYSIELNDPVTVDFSKVASIPVDFEKAREICEDRGTYLLILYNDQSFTRKIGSLGERFFKRGYYVYVGSAMKGLEGRIRRHLGKNKKSHWHLDYLLPGRMGYIKTYRIRRRERLEGAVARKLLGICDDHVPGFGASDSEVVSHLFYFTDRPFRRRNFLDLILDFQVFKPS